MASHEEARTNRFVNRHARSSCSKARACRRLGANVVIVLNVSRAVLAELGQALTSNSGRAVKGLVAGRLS